MTAPAVVWLPLTPKERLAHPQWAVALSGVRKNRVGPICGELGYISRRTGQPCGAPRKKGGDKGCRKHGGGRTQEGPAAPQYVHGRHVRRYQLAGKAQERYERHLESEDYLALQDEIALTRGQIERAEARLADLEGLEAPQDGPAGLVQARQRAKETEALRGELRALNAQLARHVEVQGRLIKDAADTLRGDQIDLYAQRLLESVRRHALAMAQDVDERVEGFLRWLEDGMRPQGGVPAELREKVLALKLGSARALRAVGDVQDDERRLVLNLTGREP